MTIHGYCRICNFLVCQCYGENRNRRCSNCNKYDCAGYQCLIDQLQGMQLIPKETMPTVVTTSANNLKQQMESRVHELKRQLALVQEWQNELEELEAMLKAQAETKKQRADGG